MIQNPGELIQNLEVGHLVRYRAPVDVFEGRLLFEVVEVRGMGRVLMRQVAPRPDAPTMEAIEVLDVERVERRLLPVKSLIPGDVLAATRRKIANLCPGGLKYPGKWLVWLEGEDYTRTWGARTTITVERRVL